MKKFILPLLIFGCTIITAQKKKDLLDEISKLKTSLNQEKARANKAESNNKTTLSKLDFATSQLDEVKLENETLLKTINNFTSVAKQKTQNVESSLKTIKEKDAQLKVVNDALTSAEETRLSQLQTFKAKLNAIGKVGIQNNQLVVHIPNTELFETVDTDGTLSEKGKMSIQKIAEVLTANPTYQIIVEGNSNAIDFKTEKALNNWDLSARQAASIVNSLQIDHQIDPKRLTAVSKGEHNTSGVETVTQIIIDAQFDEFYSLIKDRMKK
ncbi:OmpA/MotB family protein [Aquimarina agarivorans]|uniref:OmpA/MotB family protein n=1 Tax=Aquimarina agarivorans TaxID=980584 RepID=UPI000248EABE|nr:OmpA family protein [Aquimarina agarivorans]